VWNGYEFFVHKEAPAISVSYTDFLSQIRAGQVASITISGQNVDGNFKQAITWPPASASPSTTPAPSGASSKPPETYTRFTTVLPPVDDQRLLPLLDEQGVVVNVKDVSGGSWLFEVAINVLPMLLFVGLLFMMGRSAQRSQQSCLASERARPACTTASGQQSPSPTLPGRRTPRTSSWRS